MQNRTGNKVCYVLPPVRTGWIIFIFLYWLSSLTGVFAADDGSKSTGLSASTPGSHIDQSIISRKAPLSEEQIVIKALKAASQQKIADILKQYGESASHEEQVKAQNEIILIKADLEKAILETMLEFASKADDTERVEKLLERIHSLQVKSPVHSDAEVVIPQAQSSARQALHEEGE